MSERSLNAYRRTPLYEQIVSQGQKAGDLPPSPTEAQIEAYFDQCRANGTLEGDVHALIGDDLTEEMLDELWDMWDMWAGYGDRSFYMGSWWDDKPHQIAYRLLLRLTRAELELNKTREALNAALIREALADPEKRAELSASLHESIGTPKVP